MRKNVLAHTQHALKLLNGEYQIILNLQNKLVFPSPWVTYPDRMYWCKIQGGRKSHTWAPFSWGITCLNHLGFPIFPPPFQRKKKNKDSRPLKFKSRISAEGLLPRQCCLTNWSFTPSPPPPPPPWRTPLTHSIDALLAESLKRSPKGSHGTFWVFISTLLSCVVASIQSWIF